MFVVTFKPKNRPDWSYFCRLRMDVGPVSDDFDGHWSVIDGPFFPFSKEHPGQKTSGVWSYSADLGRLGFFDADANDRYLLLWPVHWNFRIICTHKVLQGIGETAHHATPDAQVVWVMGPGVMNPSRLPRRADRNGGGESRPGNPKNSVATFDDGNVIITSR